MNTNQIQNLTFRQPSAEAVVVNDQNLQTGIIFKYKHILKNVKCWHKFIVNNVESLTRNEVLKSILDHVHPLDLIPVFYANDPNTATAHFLARNCEGAVEKLCRDNLVVDHPYNKSPSSSNFKPFKLSIILNFANTNDIKIDVQKNVYSVLTKRIDIISKRLDLDRFCEDLDLLEFCPLSQPKIMYFVLHIAKGFPVQELVLTNNEIKLLTPLDLLAGTKITLLDLSNNKIASLEDLDSIKLDGLKDLRLTGNLLCDCEEDVYVSKIKTLFPTLEILDGIPMTQDKLPITKKYSLCDYESADLVNEFLEYFFTVYDSERRNLSGLYHKNAMFSLTCVYLAGQLSSNTASLRQYSNISRNLKKSADLSKISEFLYKGRDNILNVFSTQLPQSRHDPFSFTADLVYKTDNCAVIVVTGVFLEKPTSLLDIDRLLGFTRSFVLEITGRSCVITNDQLHVYNGLTYQERNSFREAPGSNQMVPREVIPKPRTHSDYNDLISTLGHLTGLTKEWSKKCLEERNYDLKASLELFVALHKADRIPYTAFV